LYILRNACRVIYGGDIIGVKVKEILESRFFKKCSLVAGGSGLSREVQAVALFDAPDGYKWFNGKEFVITSGYLFKNNVELFKAVINHLHENNGGAMGIKINRFLGSIPEEIIELCNKLRFPLIALPDDVPWTQVINAVNSLAMNKYILHIHDYTNNNRDKIDDAYLDKKINDVLKNLSVEMDSPAIIIDLIENKVFNNPESYKLQYLEGEGKLLYEPTFNHQREIICDKLNIIRIRDLEKGGSWIVMPIEIQTEVVAYLVVGEIKDEVDYYDLFSIRLTYILLTNLYEQLYFMNSIESRLQDELTREIINGKCTDEEKLSHKIQSLHWDMRSKYVCISIKQLNCDIRLYEHREKIKMLIHKHFIKEKVYCGLSSENEVVLFNSIGETDLKSLECDLKKRCMELIGDLKYEVQKGKFTVGIGSSIDCLYRMRKSYLEGQKAMEIGKYIYSGREILFYNELGPFGLFRIEAFKEGETKALVEGIYPLFIQEDRDELLSTLKAYLDCQGNCNLAAKQLYLHSNTVRYRISKIQQLCNVNLDNPVERLKIEIAIKFEGLLGI
jgi:PucR family transcriptional regulator, purine catabolism regulatory protein